MNFENFEFTIEENEEGYTVIIKGDKEKIKRKLDALDSFIAHKERSYSFHESMKAKYKNRFQDGEHPFKHGHSDCGCREADSADQNDK